MTGPRTLLARVASLLHARRLDARLAEEMQTHLELATDEHIASRHEG